MLAVNLRQLDGLSLLLIFDVGLHWLLVVITLHIAVGLVVRWDVDHRGALRQFTSGWISSCLFLFFQGWSPILEHGTDISITASLGPGLGDRAVSVASEGTSVDFFVRPNTLASSRDSWPITLAYAGICYTK